MFRRNIPYRKKMTETKETKRTNHWLTKAIWTHSKHYTPWWNTESFSFRNRNKASCLLSPLLFNLVLEFLPSHPRVVSCCLSMWASNTAASGHKNAYRLSKHSIHEFSRKVAFSFLIYPQAMQHHFYHSLWVTRELETWLHSQGEKSDSLS